MRLDLSALRASLLALQKSLRFLADVAPDAVDLREQFRAAAIQGFETTHEVAYKMVKRHLESIVADATQVDALSYRDLMRRAAEAGIVEDPMRFAQYRDARNLTAHTYNGAKAEQIVALLPQFVADVQWLLARLEAG